MSTPKSLLDAPLPSAEEAREMCHSQGKVYVVMREGDDEHIWAEWPDGTMDCCHRKTGVIMRTRPDGEVVQVDPDNRALDAPPSAAAPELSM